MSLEVGQIFAGYRIVRVLGSGGMGQVYLAAHPRLPREDALKVLPPELTGDPEFRARFLREADLVAGMSHPHIVRVHDRGESDGHLWISMDYVAGTDVGRLLDAFYPDGMPLDEAAPIIAAVASALDYAHHRGLLHRDVKPANILLTNPDGQARRAFLADFGIARRIDDATGLTETNMTVGTAAYAAPEQLKGEHVDGRADQYALACTAFHMLTGRQPYLDSNAAVVISRHVNAPPPAIGERRPDLAALDGVFATAMAKDPAARFGGCGEFAARLGSGGVNMGSDAPAFAYAGDIPPTPDTQETRPGFGALAATASLRQKPRAAGRLRHPAVLAGALAGIAALVAAGVFAAGKLTEHRAPATAAAPTSAPTPTASPPNTGPFTGVYRADFTRVTGIDGQAGPGMQPASETWAIRSACGQHGCVATASRLTGEAVYASTMVLDQVGDGWLAVNVGSDKCGDTAEGELWETFTLQPRPDGSFAGEVTEIIGKGCANKRTVTFTRTSDVDVNTLPDPGALPPRVVSPAEGLHGRYRQTATQSNGFREEHEYVVRTDCLRAGDRCMSLFHHPPTAALALVFGDGNWVYDREVDSPCQRGGAVSHVHISAQFPLPAPPPNPVTLIAGHGRQDISGPPSPCKSTSFDMSFARLGD